jgi:hypothetical protein
MTDAGDGPGARASGTIQDERPPPGGDKAESLIEIRLGSVAQLFHTLDPTPFREGDLAAEAEDYILSYARDLPADARIRLVLHLPGGAGGADLSGAVRGFFAARAEAESRALRELFRDGWRALIIALAVVAVCLLLAWQIGRPDGGGLLRSILSESLVIFGWVAMWHPAQIFLYDWLPITRRRRVFRQLAAATVEVRAGS